MELDLPLLILALISAVFMAISSLRARPIAADWALVSVLVIGIASAGLMFFPDHAGLAAFGVWFLLGWSPMLLTRLVVFANLQHRPSLASVAVWTMYVLHPTQAYRLQAKRMRVIALEQQGRAADAIAAIDAMVRVAPRTAGQGALWEQLIRLRLEERWDELDAVLEAIPDSATDRQPAMAVLLVRLDLEVGRRTRAFVRFSRHVHLLSSAALGHARDLALLALFAFAGHREQCELLFGAQLRSASRDMKELWLRTADASAGDASALAALERLAREGSPAVARSARARVLFADRVREEPLSSAHHALLASLARDLDIDRRYRFGAARAARPIVTYALGAILLAVFSIEMALGGSTDELVLIRMGALVPTAVITAGEVHRLGAFLFLHYGAAHLVFNLLGLLIIAPFVERGLGRAKFAIVYFASGLAGGVLAVLREAFLGAEPQILVGASGSIMGAVGASVAILLLGYRRERVAPAKRRLFVLLMLVALQTYLDTVVVNISQLAHTTGAVVGFLVTLAIHRMVPSRGVGERHTDLAGRL